MSLSALTAHLYLTTHATATRGKLDTAARVRVVRGGLRGQGVPCGRWSSRTSPSQPSRSLPARDGARLVVREASMRCEQPHERAHERARAVLCISC